MRRKLKQLLIGVALFAVSSLICWVAGEGVFRLFGLQPFRQHHKIFGEPDPVLGWTLKPNFGGWHRTREYQVWEQVNSIGVREKEPADLGDGLRVLVLGDSFAEGYTVTYENRISAWLAGDLEAWATGLEKSPVDVFNAGIGGYSTDQQLLWFLKYRDQIKPDLTVLLWCDNDLLGNVSWEIHRGRKPRFVLVGDEIELTGVPVTVPPRPPWHARVRSGSWLYMTARHRLWRRPTKPVGWEMWGVPPDPRTKEAWRVTEALLARLKQETGNRLIVFAIVSRPCVFPERWAAELRRFGIPASRWQPRRITARLAQVCERQQIPLVDAFPGFHAAAALGQQTYFKRDGHWNDRGHRLAAQILAQFIMERVR